MSRKSINKRQRLKRRRHRDLRKPPPVAVVPIPNASAAGLFTLSAGLIGEMAQPIRTIAFGEALKEQQQQI